jgi:hypothetical protein
MKLHNLKSYIIISLYMILIFFFNKINWNKLLKTLSKNTIFQNPAPCSIVDPPVGHVHGCMTKFKSRKRQRQEPQRQEAGHVKVAVISRDFSRSQRMHPPHMILSFLLVLLSRFSKYYSRLPVRRECNNS